MTFDVDNTGLGTLTNVRIVGVTPSNGGVIGLDQLPGADLAVDPGRRARPAAAASPSPPAASPPARP